MAEQRTRNLVVLGAQPNVAAEHTVLCLYKQIRLIKLERISVDLGPEKKKGAVR